MKDYIFPGGLDPENVVLKGFLLRYVKIHNTFHKIINSLELFFKLLLLEQYFFCWQFSF